MYDVWEIDNQIEENWIEWNRIKSRILFQQQQKERSKNSMILLHWIALSLFDDGDGWEAYRSMSPLIGSCQQSGGGNKSDIHSALKRKHDDDWLAWFRIRRFLGLCAILAFHFWWRERERARVDVQNWCFSDYLSTNSAHPLLLCVEWSIERQPLVERSLCWANPLSSEPIQSHRATHIPFSL